MNDHYEFILVLIEPEKMIASALFAQKGCTFEETYHIKNPNLEYIFKLLKLISRVPRATCSLWKALFAPRTQKLYGRLHIV
jgi:hypothetical protein